MKLFPNLALTKRQLLLVVLLIANFWYSGVLLVAGIDTYFGWNYLTLGILFLLSYPIAVLNIRGVNWFLRLRPAQSKGTITIMVLSVTVMHVISLLTLAGWYEVSGTGLSLATGWLVFFSATALLASYNQSQR